MKRGSFLAGFLSCLLLTGITTVAYAAGIRTTNSTNRFFLDGKEVDLAAYNINDSNYVRIAEVGKLVDFNVYWDPDTNFVHIEADRPYTGEKTEEGPAAYAAVTRSIPQAGDVIRCDDGTDYTVTDVSHYDGNLFAAGPMAALPTATCDWSKLPQPELPAEEARHFTVDGREYLYVRNRYETLRMLYTLYNAIGDNPETWANGEPVKHPSGNDKVKISLTVNTEDSYQSFWPWRGTEITGIFNSCPAGTFRFEVWDVYKDGAFQRTEYHIQTDF